MNVIQDDIRDAIEKELIAAKERFPLFASLHEAAAVIAEERDEAFDEMKRLNIFLSAAWEKIKEDSDKTALEYITKAKIIAERLSIEACQVAAMCEKAIQSAAVWNEERKDNERC